MANMERERNNEGSFEAATPAEEGVVYQTPPAPSTSRRRKSSSIARTTPKHTTSAENENRPKRRPYIKKARLDQPIDPLEQVLLQLVIVNNNG